MKDGKALARRRSEWQAFEVETWTGRLRKKDPELKVSIKEVFVTKIECLHAENSGEPVG